MWRSIRHKLLFWFLLLSVLPMLVLSAVNYHISADLITKEVRNGLEAIALGKAQALEASIGNIRATVSNFSRSPAIIQAINILQNQPQAAITGRYMQYFQAVIDNFGYSSLILTDAQGKLLYTSDGSIRNIQDIPEIEKVFNRATTLIEPSISDFTESREQLVFYVAAPVMDTDNSILGAIIVGFGNNSIELITSDYTGLGLTGEVLLIAPVRDQLRLINLNRHQISKNTLSVAELLMDQELITQAVNGDGGIATTTDYRQQEVILSKEYIPSLHGGIIVKIDTAEAQSSLAQLRNSAIAISGLITVLVILIALNLAKSISQPIIDLTQVTRSIVSGEFNWEAPIDTNDEIGRLARSFNAMLNRLHHSFMDLEAINQELEDRVEERTKSLQWANLEIQMLNEKLQEENLRMSSELEITKRLQQLILPRDHELLKISNLDIAGFMQPATEVGGDYYDVIQNNGSIRIGVGDITGHGLESGILMIMLQTAIRTLTHSQENDPVRFMNILNQVIYENVQRMNTDKSLSLLLLEYSNNRINLSGQHEEVIIAHPDGTVECIDTMDLGFPLGLEADISQFVNQYSIDLSRGDVVVLYTDGITEAENSEHQFYSKERLCQVIQRHIHLTAGEIREEIIADLKAHIGSQTIFDDITLVVLKRK